MASKGVYSITCLPSNTTYIGSAAKSIRQRWGIHLCELRANRHVNAHLQNAWNKYGEAAFKFDVLEEVNDPARVVEREQYWMDAFRQQGRALYNIAPIAGSMLGFKMPKDAIHQRKNFAGFVSPGGILYNDVDDLQVFCESHGLNRSAMYQVASGRIGHHRGWIAITDKAKDSPIYGFVAPDGTEYKNIVQLRPFCTRFGLDPSSMTKVYYGKRLQHKGWRSLSWQDAMDFRLPE